MVLLCDLVSLEEQAYEKKQTKTNKNPMMSWSVNKITRQLDLSM